MSDGVGPRAARAALALLLLGAACGRRTDQPAVSRPPAPAARGPDGGTARTAACAPSDAGAAATCPPCRVPGLAGDAGFARCGACAQGRCVLCALDGGGAHCRRINRTWNACTEEHQCVECLDDTDCADNAAALGPRCAPETRTCTCAADADCAGNGNGSRCVPEAGGYCGCQGDGDCPRGRACAAGGELRVCEPG